jgi:hypothetical protein
MSNIVTIKVNFKGGIIPPEELYNILVAAGKSQLMDVRFGLRQQLLFDVGIEELDNLTAELEKLGVVFELGNEEYPNILSSYPAEEIFIKDTWLTENIYNGIFHSFSHKPRLKINISDNNQSFTPMLTGNINWVASPQETGFWHLFIRFPKTNVIYEWKDEVHTEDIATMSLHIEEIILQERADFYENDQANGDKLYAKVMERSYATKPAAEGFELSPFNLPYYEGLNQYSDDKYWLGIYRRDELFSINFLKEVCLLCLKTGTHQLCSTPWKTIIIKAIDENDKAEWNQLLDKHQINLRHAANELNFQIEDNSFKALQLKQHLVKYLNNDDTRTFGVCIGIKTRKKSEVFCSILVRRRPLIRIGKTGFFHLYDILCAKDYNPNERTDFVYSRDNPKFVLSEQLRRAVLSYYDHTNKHEEKHEEIPVADGWEQ